MKPWGCLFFVNTRKNFKSNILVVVFCLVSKGLCSIQGDLQTPKNLYTHLHTLCSSFKSVSAGKRATSHCHPAVLSLKSGLERLGLLEEKIAEIELMT